MNTNFREWAKQHEGNYAEHFVNDLQDYDLRENLFTLVKGFVGVAEISDYSSSLLDATFFLISATHVEESVFNEIPKNEDLIIFLASKVIVSKYEDAIPLFVIALGDIKGKIKEAEDILLETVHFKDEYTSRMSLLSLAKLNSNETESLAEKAWASGLQYQKIACLWALKQINSVKLLHYLGLAHDDGQLYVVENAIEIETKSA